MSLSDQIIQKGVGFEVITAVVMKSPIFAIFFDSEDGSNMFLRNVS
jgi:hypothetical protein